MTVIPLDPIILSTSVVFLLLAIYRIFTSNKIGALRAAKNTHEELSKKKVVSVHFESYFEAQLYEVVLGASRSDFPQQ